MQIPAALLLSAILSLAVVAWAGNPTYTVLHTFQGSPTDGSNPENVGTLFRDASGNIYGTTQNGGSTACIAIGGGTLFKLRGSTETILHDFSELQPHCGHDGSNPIGAAVMDSSGNIYGTTSAGGSAGHSAPAECSCRHPR